MPARKGRWTFNVGRNMRLFLHVEVGLTGVRASLNHLRERLGAKAPSSAESTVRPSDVVAPAAGFDQRAPVPDEPAQTHNQLAEQRRKLKHVRQQLEKDRKELAHLRAKLSQARGAVLSPDLSEESAPVFFLVGRAKSGTSWVKNILDSHPEILCKGEGRFFGRTFRENSERARLKLQPTSLYGAILNSEYLRTWAERTVWLKGEDAEEQLVKLTRLATKYFLMERLAMTSKRIVGDKTPFTGTEVIAEIADICPDAKVIHIIRDGRDVVISTVHHMWNHAKHEGGIFDLRPQHLAKRSAYRSNPRAFIDRGETLFVDGWLAGTAKNWASLVGKAREDGPALLGRNYMEVRYEDLLVRPVEETERLLRFLGADASVEIVEHCVEATSFEKVARRERGQEDSTSFFRKGVAGDWRNVFTEEDRQIFKEAAGDMLIELGYEKDNGW